MRFLLGANTFICLAINVEVKWVLLRIPFKVNSVNTVRRCRYMNDVFDTELNADHVNYEENYTETVATFKLLVRD